MQRAERRNISITNDEVSKALDQSDNVSKYIERAILFYLEQHQRDYADKDIVEELERKVEILNENYLQTKDVLEKIAQVLFKN